MLSRRKFLSFAASTTALLGLGIKTKKLPASTGLQKGEKILPATIGLQKGEIYNWLGITKTLIIVRQPWDENAVDWANRQNGGSVAKGFHMSWLSTKSHTIDECFAEAIAMCPTATEIVLGFGISNDTSYPGEDTFAKAPIKIRLIKELHQTYMWFIDTVWTVARWNDQQKKWLRPTSVMPDVGWPSFQGP